MDVQVKLLLRGGHVWQFRCSEDDPIIFGIVSALPGADTGNNMPADGLVQVEGHTGERLFLARSSLVAVELRPTTGGPGLESARRSVVPAPRLPDGGSSPAAFALVSQALPDDLHRALIESVLAQGASALPQGRPGENRELDLGQLPAVERALASRLGQVRGALGVPDLLETHLELRLFAVADRGSLALEEGRGDVLSFVYHFHAPQKTFTGGGVRLFDSKVGNGAANAAPSFRDLPIENNGLLVFPGQVVSAGLPLRAAGSAFADALFVVRGALRRGLASG